MDELTEEVYSEELKKFEREYYDQLRSDTVTPKTQFEYAWCLVRSKYPADIRKGILFLEQLLTTHSENERDYLYYLAIGHARIREYGRSLRCLRVCLEREPTNQQLIRLDNLIKKKMSKEGAATKIAAAAGIASLTAAAVFVFRYARKYL